MDAAQGPQQALGWLLDLYDDVDQIQGRAEQLIGKLQNRYGIARDEAQRQVDAWMHNTRIEPSPSR